MSFFFFLSDVNRSLKELLLADFLAKQIFDYFSLTVEVTVEILDVFIDKKQLENTFYTCARVACPLSSKESRYTCPGF